MLLYNFFYCSACCYDFVFFEVIHVFLLILVPKIQDLSYCRSTWPEGVEIQELNSQQFFTNYQWSIGSHSLIKGNLPDPPITSNALKIRLAFVSICSICSTYGMLLTSQWWINATILGEHRFMWKFCACKNTLPYFLSIICVSNWVWGNGPV